MEAVNNMILFAIAVLSIINLIIEIEDVKTYKYELVLKICFGAVAVAACSLSLIFYKHNIFNTILYAAMAVTLLNRIIIRKKK